MDHIPEFSNSVRELVALVSGSEKKLESQNQLLVTNSMFSGINNQCVVRNLQSNMDEHRTLAQGTHIPSTTTSITGSAIRE